MIEIKSDGLDKLNIWSKTLSKKYQDAKADSFFSSGHKAQQMLKAWMETGGGGTWKPLNPLSEIGRAEDSHGKPALYYFAKFSIYQKTEGGFKLGFGKSYKKGIDPKLSAFIARVAGGETQTMSKAKQRHLAGLGFPVRKTTNMITPERPIMQPIMKDIEKEMSGIIQKVIWEGINFK